MKRIMKRNKESPDVVTPCSMMACGYVVKGDIYPHIFFFLDSMTDTIVESTPPTQLKKESYSVWEMSYIIKSRVWDLSFWLVTNDGKKYLNVGIRLAIGVTQILS